MILNNDDLTFDTNDLNFFVNNIWTNEFHSNEGGMGAPDLFSLWFILYKYKPKIIVESGVWKGLSTKLIRKTLPESKIISLDPINLINKGFKDNNKNTTYFIGNNFVDFKDLDLSMHNPDDILCFFDCHQNALFRLLQCYKKNIKNIFFNDNYPKNCGSHYTIQHILDNDDRKFKISKKNKDELISKIYLYKVFPNIYPGKIKTGEGFFDCESYFDEDNNIKKYEIFKNERNSYRWNTFVKLNI